MVFAADTIIVPPNSGKAFFKDVGSHLLPLNIAYTTDGSGHLKLINSADPVDDDILVPANSGKMFLKGADLKTYPALVLYTTDGNGNVIPIPAGGGSGVTSVGLALPNIFSVSGSPVTTSGTLTGTLATQTANKVFASATSGGAATPAFRALVAGDVPALSYVSSVGASSPLASSGGLTPNLTCQAASGSQAGCLSSADWTTFNAKQAAIPAYTGTYYVDKAGTDSGSCGSLQSPCLTIQQALTNIGPTASAADVKKPRTVIISPGAYDESLTIPNGRIISLLGTGTVVLGDGAGTNWNSTVARSITWTVNTADVFGSDIKPSLTIGTIAPADATSTFIAESNNFTISGNLNVTGDGLTNSLNLHGVKIWGALVHTDASLTNWQAYRTLIIGTVTTTGNLVLERCYDCRFNALVSVNAYNMVIDSNFAAGMTVQSIQQNLLPNGMFLTNFAGTFTGPANSLRLDNTSNQYFRANSASLAGGATKVLITDSVTSQSASGSQPTCSANNRGLQWLIQGGTGVADIYQVCQKDAADAYNWATH